MSRSASIGRGNHAGHRARPAPLSGRRGALPPGVRQEPHVRPAGTIAVARKLAEEEQ